MWGTCIAVVVVCLPVLYLNWALASARIPSFQAENPVGVIPRAEFLRSQVAKSTSSSPPLSPGTAIASTTDHLEFPPETGLCPKRHCRLTELGLNGPVYLWSMVTADSCPLLEHFIRHYIKAGVPVENMQFMLHALTETSRKESLAVFGKLGIPSTQVNVTDFFSSDIKRDHVNTYIQSLPANAWVTYPDLDEFFHYPCAPWGAMSPSHPAGLQCIGGRMVDRLPAISPIPSIRVDTSIESQFPFCVRVRSLHHAAIVQAMNYKTILFPAQHVSPDGTGWKAKTKSAHVLYYYTSTDEVNARKVRVVCDVFKEGGSIDHYAWTKEQIELTVRKKDLYTQLNDPGRLQVYTQLCGLLQSDAAHDTDRQWRFREDARTRLSSWQTCCPDPAAP